MAVVPVLLLCVAGVLSAPYLPEFNNGDVIAKTLDCPEDHSGIHRDGGNTFSYEGGTENSIVGSSAESTGMKISARVYIQPTRNCMYTMQISDAKLMMKSKNSLDYVQADESKKFSRELEAQELVFSTKMGNIHEIFPSTVEKTHVLNIKRGILSTLQMGNPDKDTTVTDVNGICKVQFSEQDGVVTKTRDFTDCTERIHSELGVQASTFQQSNLPINPLNSTSICRYSLSQDRTISNAVCDEVHILRPFSAGFKGKSGAITRVWQRLNREYGDQKLPQSNLQAIGKPTSLLFRYEHEEMKPDSSIVDRVDKIMSNLVDQRNKMNFGAKQSNAHEFTRLVSLFRQLDRKRMMPVWNKYFDCTRSRVCGPRDEDIRDVYRQYLLDALTYCGTSTCVYVVHNVIIDEAVTGEKVNMFLQGVALVAKPTKAMIRDILEIAGKQPSRQAYLTLGTLLLRFCTANREECAYGKTNPVTQAEVFLEGKLGQECEGQENVDRVEELIRAVKAIGNAGRPVHIWNTLARCARMSLHQNVSIAALDAMRHLPCSKDRLDDLHSMLSNVEMDPERRVHVFLAIMRCPSRENLERVVDQLNKEPSRQLGSFMWSHLTNLNESSDLSQTEVRQTLRDILRTKSLRIFDLDRTKYSRSWESSLHSRMLKSGVKAEGHLVFHPESYLPRSALLNLTAHVMGVPLNMLEMAIRVEGLETVIEDVFGPHGVMPDSGILQLFNITVTKDDLDQLRQSRDKRGVGASMQENIADLHARVNKRRIQPSGSLSVKMFGHDVRLMSYDDIFWMIDQIDNMNVIELLLKLAKGGHKTFTKSVMFLEMTQTVPTGLGFPLKLKLTGSAVGSVELDGKFDIRNMFWGPSHMELRGFVKPSAVAEISGQMGIESHFIRSGMFINASMFTSQVLKGGVLYKEGSIVKVNLDAPEEPVELFNFSTTPFLYFNEDLSLVDGVSRRISPEFCLNATMTLGLGLCTSFAVPVAFREYESPYFPLSGPAHFGVKLVKADAKLTTYELKMKYDKQKVAGNSKEYLGTFLLGTPGATYARGVSGMVKLIESPNGRTLTLGSAEHHKKVEFMVQYRNDTRRFEMEARTNIFSNKFIGAKFLFFNDTIYSNKHIGALVSANYGDFKVQQMWKFVRSSAAYKLFTKTTYYPGKHLTGEVGLVPSTRTVFARFDANQFNQSMDLIGSIVNTANAKGLNFTAVHHSSGKNGTVFVGYVHNENSKRVVVNATLAEKSAELELGYYRYEDGYEVLAGAKVCGRRVELFTNYSSYNVDEDTPLSEVLLGVRYSNQTVGLRFSRIDTNNGKMTDACAGTVFNHLEEARACISLEKEAYESGFYRRFAVLGKYYRHVGTIDFQLEKDSRYYAFNTSVDYNAKTMAHASWQFDYNGANDAELSLTGHILKKSVSFRIYTEPKDDSGAVMGVEAKGFGKLVAVTATYISTALPSGHMYKVVFEAFYNKKLPVSWTVELTYPGGIGFYLGSTLKLKNYALKGSYLLKRDDQGKTTFVWDTSFDKEERKLLGFMDAMTLVYNGEEKSLKQLWTITVFGKQFEYGWNLNYLNLGNANQCHHQIKLGLQYARGKTLMLTTDLVNSEAEIGASFNFRFWHRSVTHTFIYQKQERRLDVAIEFLPNMYVRVMMRLDRKEGWKLTSRVQFDWKRMNRVLESVAKYVNNEKRKALSFSYKAYGQELYFETQYVEERRLATIVMSAFGKTLMLSGRHDQVKNSVSLSANVITAMTNTLLLELVGACNSKEVSFEVRRKESLFKVSGLLDREARIANAAVDVRGKPIVAMKWMVKQQNALVFTLNALSRDRLAVEGKVLKSQKSAFLYIDLLKPNWNIGFAGKYNDIQKSVTVTAEALKTVVGVTVRADIKERIVGANVFTDNKVSGWLAYYDPLRKAAVFNVSFTPQVSFQTVAEVIADRILKFTTQRKIGHDIVNETSFSYDLSMYESRLIFQWNTNTVDAVKDAIVPIVQAAIQKAKTSSIKLDKIARGVIKTVKVMSKEGQASSQEYYKKMAEKLLLLISSANATFQDTDFTAHREKVLVQLKETLKQVSDRVLTLYRRTRQVIEEQGVAMRDNVPVYLEKVKELQKDLEVVLDIALKIGRNLTDSAKPVVFTAVKLAKEFKVRGRTMEELVDMVTKVVMAKIEHLVIVVKKETMERIPAGIAAIKTTSLPYADMTVEELFKKADLVARRATFNYDAQKVAAALKKELKSLKQVVQTELNNYINLVKVEAMKLPELVKSKIARSMELGEEYGKVVEELYKEGKDFLKPVLSLAKHVNKSICKHYGPIVDKLSRRLNGHATELYKHYRKQVLPYVSRVDTVYQLFKTEVLPYISSIEQMTRDVKGQMVNLKVVEKKVLEMSNVYLEALLDRLAFLPDEVEKVNRTVMAYIETARNKYHDLSVATSDEIMDMVYEVVGMIAQEAIKRVQQGYKIREEVVKDVIARSKDYYTQAMDMYKKVQKSDIEDMLQDALLSTEELMENFSEKAKEVFMAISKIYLGKPFLDSWTKESVLEYISQFGVSGKVASLALKFKDSNLTEIILQSGSNLRDAALVMYSKAAKRACAHSKVMNAVVSYFRSVPRKSFEDFTAEVDEFFVIGGQNVVSTLMKRYKMFHDAAVKAGQEIVQFYDDYYLVYVVPFVDTYEILRTKSVYIYEENKEEAEYVWNHYKSMASHSLGKKIEKARQVMMKEYDALYRMVDQVLQKYGDMTWEDLALKLYGTGLQTYNEARFAALQKHGEVRKIAEKTVSYLGKELREQKRKLVSMLREYKEKLDTELIPKVLALYKKYISILKTHVGRFQEKSKACYDNVIYTAAQVYNNNKDKTLEQIVNEVADAASKRAVSLARDARVELNHQYTRAAIVVKDILLPELKKEIESMFNQTVRASVVLGNATVESFYPHYRLAVSGGGKLIDRTVEMIPRIIQNAEALIREVARNIPAYKKQVKSVVLKYLTVCKGNMTVLVSKHLAPLYAKYMDLKPQLDKQYRVLVAIFAERFATEKMEEVKLAAKKYIDSLGLKKKYIEMQTAAKEFTAKVHKDVKQRVDDLVNKVDTAELKQSYNNVMESMTFTLEQVKPKVESVILEFMDMAGKVPVVFVQRAVFFRQFPEECMWRSYQDIVETTEMAVNFVRNENYGERYEEAKAAMLGFFFEVTDVRTKEALIDLVDKVQMTYAKLRVIPQTVQEKYIQLKQIYITALQKKYEDINAEGRRQAGILKEKTDQVKAAAVQYWNFVKSEWKRCPLSPIFEHEVWSELLQEITSHELMEEGKVLTTELFALAKTGKDHVFTYSRSRAADLEQAIARLEVTRDQVKELFVHYRGKLQNYHQMVSEKIKACRISCQKKFELVKRFYKEKTIQEIVEILASLVQKAKVNLAGKREAFENAMNVWISNAKVQAQEKMDMFSELALEYRDKVIEVSRVYKARAEQEMEKYRPVVMQKYTQVSMLLNQYQNEAKRSFNDKTMKFIAEGKKMWNHYRVVERFDSFKKMKIRDTIMMIHGQVMLAPSQMRELLSVYKAAALDCSIAMKSKVTEMLSPALKMLALVKGPLSWVGNEVNETFVFIYRYYGLQGKASSVKNVVLTEAVAKARMVPGIIKSRALQVKLATLRAVYDALVEADNVDLDEVKSMVKSYFSRLPKVDIDVSVPLAEIRVKVKNALSMVNWEHPSVEQLKSIVKKYVDDAQVAAQQYTESAKNAAYKYADEVKDRTKRYVEDVKVAAKKYVEDAKITGNKYVAEAKVLAKSYVDKAMKLPNAEKVRQMLHKYKYYLTYITFEPSEGRIVIRIPHSAAIQPSFSYHVNKVSNVVKQTMYSTKESVLRLAEDFKLKTEELRKDLAASYNIHSKLAAESWNTMRMYGKMAFDNGHNIWNSSMDSACRMFREDVKPAVVEIYAIAKEAYENLSQVKDLNEAAEKARTYLEVLARHSRRAGKKGIKNIGRKGLRILRKLERAYIRVMEQVKPYHALVRAAVEDLLEGKQLSDAMKNVKRQALKVYKSTMRTGRWKVKEFIRANPKVLRIIEEYKKIHAAILEKHLVKLRRVLKLAKVGVDRTVRIVKKQAIEMSSRPVSSPLKKTAMVFGRSHVMTFDKKFYEIPEYNKKGCTYLLARDFHHGNFTILSQKDKLIIVTPDITFFLNDNMDAWITVNGQTIHVKGLPVQSPTAKCILDGAFVKCDFKQGLRLTCDVNHFDCMVELSGWHYGKTEGLLGTNNNEVFDDWRMPGGALADTVGEFVDSWEVSGDHECKKSVMEIQTPKCNRLPSSKCSEVFGDDSPLAKYFSIIDPSPFQRSCQIDTSNCQVTDVAHAHCNSTASYVNLLRGEGHMATYLAECAFFSDGKRTEVKGSHWKQAPKKSVDIVVLMSERRSASSMRKAIANMMYSLNKKLVKGGYKTSYALVGFGGNLVHERPHAHSTHDGRTFMDGYTVSSIIKDMPYTGRDSNTNDVAGAIQFATTLSFRPEASRIFIVFNGHKQMSNIDGATVDEAEYALRYEANASLFMFDQYSFKNIAKTRVIGQSSRRLYLGPVYRELPVVSKSFPDGLFSTIAYESRGAVFSGKIKMRTMKSFASGLADSVLFTLKSSSQLCKSCYLYWGNAGQGIPICRTNSRMTC